ncbi:hypothetical protein FRC04_011005 [Tulasnella sp. 424]|nr:hypothetical protein FRC04_011005 [Tulasnella sp. 424]
MYTPSLAVLALSVASAHAHSIFQRVWVNGVDQGLVTGIRYPDYNGPITDVTSNDIICNGGVNPLHTPLPTTIINIPAGATVGAEWHHGLNANPGIDPTDPADPIDSSHKGPIMAYLAKVDSALTTTVTGLQWFKIWEDGFHSDGTWAVDTMITNKGLVNFTIPTCIPSGNYLLRVELIALHGASVYPGAQFYWKLGHHNDEDLFDYDQVFDDNLLHYNQVLHNNDELIQDDDDDIQDKHYNDRRLNWHSCAVRTMWRYESYFDITITLLA